MTGTLFDPPEDARQPAKARGIGKRESQDTSADRIALTPPARRNAPPGTSGTAATRIAGHTAQQRAEVLAAVVAAGAHGATDAEIEAATGIRAQSVSPRRGELRKLRLIEDSGRRRPTPRGRPAAVWVARTSARGPEAAAETAIESDGPEGCPP